MNCIIESRDSDSFSITANTYKDCTIYFQHTFSHILSFFICPSYQGSNARMELEAYKLHNNYVVVGVKSASTVISFYYRI